MPYPLFIIIALISAFSATAYHAFVKHSHSSHIAADVRGAVVLSALAYLLASLSRFDQPLTERFLPVVENLLAVPCALYIWTQVLTFRRVFAAREEFEAYTETCEGERLQQAMHDDEELLVSISHTLRKTRLNCAVQLALIVALSGVSAALGTRISWGQTALVMLLMVSTAGMFALFGLFNNEQYYAGEGVSLSAPQRAKRLFALLVFTLIAAVLGAFLASEKSLLPFSLIVNFFAWLFANLFPDKPMTRQPVPFEMDTLEMGMGPLLPPQLLTPEDYKPLPIWDYLQYAVLTLVVIAFIWFMVKPLILRDGGRGGVPLIKRLRRLFTAWLKTLKAAVAAFFASLRGGEAAVRVVKTDAAALRRLETALLSGYSPAKRREMKHSVTLFARLIVWGSETCQVYWRPTLAPAEYCALLCAALLPCHHAAIIRSGELFERALYAKSTLTAEERDEFSRYVRDITAGDGDGAAAFTFHTHGIGTSS
jgi:hypothetical protein